VTSPRTEGYPETANEGKKRGGLELKGVGASPAVDEIQGLQISPTHPNPIGESRLKELRPTAETRVRGKGRSAANSSHLAGGGVRGPHPRTGTERNGALNCGRNVEGEEIKDSTFKDR